MSVDQTNTLMSTEELGIVLDWAADEGWNSGLADAQAFHSADPGGFFVARIDGAPVAAISVVNHDARNAFLGLYISRPDWRGKGIGFNLWNHALNHAAARSVGLDGVPDQEANYRKSGFAKTGSSLRYVGNLPSQESPRMRAVTHSDMAALVALDARSNGFARPRFLTSWLGDASPLRASRLLMNEGEIQGFATWRLCREGVKIGPIVAPDTALALEIIGDIAAVACDRPLVIDIPETNLDLRRELESAGFKVPFVTARMYRGAVPKQCVCLQAIATMELG